MSFSILRTNTGLTTNVKIVVDSNYNLFLESIESNSQLSDIKFKKLQFKSTNYYDELLPYFFKNTPKEIIFDVKYDNDNDIMYKDFKHQNDDLYKMGCKNIVNNKQYLEEYECFSPLYIDGGDIPKYFIIFRIDGPGIINLNNLNFREEFLNKMKCVKEFNMYEDTPLSEWLKINIVENEFFPDSPFYMDFRKLEFSNWRGINMDSGGYAQKSIFMDSTLEYENLYFDLQKFVYDGYKENNLAFPNILNMSFLFDDTPATPDGLKKWSINRYFGFYIDDLEYVTGISPNNPIQLKTDVEVSDGNILISIGSTNPFNVFLNDDFDKNENKFLEISGKIYKISEVKYNSVKSTQKIKSSSGVWIDQYQTSEIKKYKIISDLNFNGLTYSSINQNTGIKINSDNEILLSDDSNYVIPGFDLADIWIIEINSKLHSLKINDDGNLYIMTDYAFSITDSQFKYWINSKDPSYTTTIEIDPLSPINFSIYKAKLTDIKDFDNHIIDTEYSKFEYELETELTQSDETKLYVTDWSNPSNPPDLEDYKIGNDVVNIPAASEYTANGETFRLMSTGTDPVSLNKSPEYNKYYKSLYLNPIWRKNPIWVKWGYQNSISSNDYPYLLNNSFISEDYNRTTNTFEFDPIREERNLDYFYSINPSSYSYIHQTLHIQDFENEGFNFDITKYVTTSNTSNYFSFLFSKRTKFNWGKIIKNTEKWSIFNSGDVSIPNSTLFRGIKFIISDIENIKLNDDKSILEYNTKNNNYYNQWKLSVLLSDCYYKIEWDEITNDLTNIDISPKSIDWRIIDSFKYEKPYSIGDIVLSGNTLYKSNTDTTITNPNITPYISTDWDVFSNSIFWSPLNTYNDQTPVFADGEYWLFSGNPISGYNKGFWVPGYVYNIGEYVFYNRNTWESLVNNNTETPGENNYWTISNIQSWSVIELWNNLEKYISNQFVVLDDILYKCVLSTQAGESPISSPTKWEKFYSTKPDSQSEYDVNTNNIIHMNNRFYKNEGNQNGEKLENGIIIYINHIFKNILIDIHFNDNTLPNLSNSDRDLLYNDIYSKITAYNFINSINNPDDRSYFTENLKYVIIKEDSIKVYDINSIQNLPTILLCDFPDKLSSRINSFKKTDTSLNSNVFKSNRKLDRANLSSVEMLNWYNDSSSMAIQIEKYDDDINIIPNYHGLKNKIYNDIFRFSGPYSPIFYKIDLFKHPDDEDDIIGNWKFDEYLTNFGIMKQNIISKVNRLDNILKLKNKPDLKSIYPIIDEFGYTTRDFFIFKSTWDNEYYLECLETTKVTLAVSNKSIKTNLQEKNNLL